MFSRVSKGQSKWLSDALRNETTGGILLLSAALVALVWATVDFNSYNQIKQFKLGPAELNLQLSLGKWAADGLLAIFFFVAGLELKHEFTHGSLRDRTKAAVPIAAAIGGMVVPALIYAAFNTNQPSAAGWGIPMATDIAFALAVLAVAGRKLPIELRAFLLTLAIVDDLGAILVIAVFYTASLNVVALFAAMGALAIFGFLQRRNVRGWFVYLPLAVLIWYLVHESGVHATVAGVAMGLLMNLKQSEPTMQIVHPISAGFAVPVFAFFTAGVFIEGVSIQDIASSPIALGIIVGLVLGKPIGVVGVAWLMARFTKASLNSNLGWWDVAAIGALSGVGFTVSLLINDLAFNQDESMSSMGTLAVLIASATSAMFAVVALQARKRARAKIKSD